ncbi:hypothetical protein V8B97DRAFT_1892440, partial [Scleroderma yunnanense]
MRNKSTLKASELYLESTLDEIVRISEMMKYRRDYEALYEDVKAQYDQLMDEKEQIKYRKRTVNPVKLFGNYRDNRLFIGATSRLFQRTRTTSEMMRRGLLSVSLFSLVSDSVVAIERDRSTEEEEISGIAIPCDTEIDDRLRGFIEETASILTQTNPFDDPGPVVDDSVGRTPATNSVGTSSSSGGDRAPHFSSGSNISLTYIENYHRTSSSVSGIDIRSPTLENVSVNVGGHDNTGSM